MGGTARKLDIGVAALHGPGHWGWIASEAGFSSFAYRGAFAGFTFTGFIDVLFLNASLLARTVLFSAFFVAIATWVFVGQADVLSAYPPARLLIRCSALIVMLGAFGAMSGDSFPFRLWPFAVALGVESHLTLSSIGTDASGTELFRRAFFSVANATVIVVLFAFSLFEETGIDARDAAVLYLSLIHI